MRIIFWIAVGLGAAALLIVAAALWSVDARDLSEHLDDPNLDPMTPKEIREVHERIKNQNRRPE